MLRRHAREFLGKQSVLSCARKGNATSETFDNLNLLRFGDKNPSHIDALAKRSTNATQCMEM